MAEVEERIAFLAIISVYHHFLVTIAISCYIHTADNRCFLYTNNLYAMHYCTHTTFATDRVSACLERQRLLLSRPSSKKILLLPCEEKEIGVTERTADAEFSSVCEIQVSNY